MGRTLPRLFAWLVLSTMVAAQDDVATRTAALARLGGPLELGEGGHRSLVQAMRDARNDQCVAIIASHPDDQYVLPAAYLRLDEGYRVVVVMMTRGEGGQNNDGPEVGDALGALRTLETETCARQLGFEVRYINRADAGYCRTAAEALELWGRTATVREVARALREVRPDIVLTTHTPAETHGHDLALVEVLPDAVELAGDANFVTEGIAPVRIDRVFRCATPDEQPWFELPTDDVDPDRGRTWREIAYLALTRSHTSQAPFREQHEFFAGANRYIGMRSGNDESHSMYAGLPDLFVELANGESLPLAQIVQLRERFDVELPGLIGNPRALIAHAVALRSQVLSIAAPAGSALEMRIRRRADALARVALHAAGMQATVTTARPVAVPGESLDFDIELSSSLPAPLVEIAVGGEHVGGSTPASLASPQPWHLHATIDVPADGLRSDPLSGLFRRTNFRMPLRCTLTMRFASDAGPLAALDFLLDLPVAIRPAAEITVRPGALLVPLRASSVDFNVHVRRNSAAPLHERLGFDVPAGFEIDPPSVDVDLERASELGFLFRLRVPDDGRSGPQLLRARIGRISTRVAVHRVEVDLPRDLRIGLIAGVDDSARNVLSQLGCRLEVLTDDVLPTRRFDDLDTILVDVRALGKRAVARAELNRLLAFAHDGGRLVILYHKDTELDFQRTGQRFWPEGMEFAIGKGRVTREDAPVQILDPSHPLLMSPNPIRPEDWDGWTQERGLYFAVNQDDSFQTPIAFADPGQAMDRGALLFAKTGEGEYVYCALALHRQLKNLHPGACRILANLVAHRRP
ncbi:MAG: PIG-L family deacetylase [Planctomycetota bacterium]